MSKLMDSGSRPGMSSMLFSLFFAVFEIVFPVRTGLDYTSIGCNSGEILCHLADKAKLKYTC